MTANPDPDHRVRETAQNLMEAASLIVRVAAMPAGVLAGQAGLLDLLRVALNELATRAHSASAMKEAPKELAPYSQKPGEMVT